jgi:hypothetical protein
MIKTMMPVTIASPTMTTTPTTAAEKNRKSSETA